MSIPKRSFPYTNHLLEELISLSQIAGLHIPIGIPSPLKKRSFPSLTHINNSQVFPASLNCSPNIIHKTCDASHSPSLMVRFERSCNSPSWTHRILYYCICLLD